MTDEPQTWPVCAAGCGEPADIDDDRGHWWCTECFFDPDATPIPLTEREAKHE